MILVAGDNNGDHGLPRFWPFWDRSLESHVSLCGLYNIRGYGRPIFFWIHRAFFSLGIGGTNLGWSSFFCDFYAVAESYAETFELG